MQLVELVGHRGKDGGGAAGGAEDDFEASAGRYDERRRLIIEC